MAPELLTLDWADHLMIIMSEAFGVACRPFCALS